VRSLSNTSRERAGGEGPLTLWNQNALAIQSSCTTVQYAQIARQTTLRTLRRSASTSPSPMLSRGRAYRRNADAVIVATTARKTTARSSVPTIGVHAQS